MDNRYEIYCLADPFFYDRLDRRAEAQSEAEFAALNRPTPDGWHRHHTDIWQQYWPDGHVLPAQGWKIHVSACLSDAERVIDAVWEHCVPRRIAFKFLRGVRVALMRNSKYAHRGSSGKLVTVYPSDEAELQILLKDLDHMLQGVRGPYILSDLRYGKGPLYVRYGGFVERRCYDANGEQVLAIEDDKGDLVPDRRGPVFAIPPWVTLPEFLAPHLAARAADTIDHLPYRFEEVLHFSNGGGVYLARDERTGDHVVVKEARPYAGLDAAGRDAVTRLTHERDILILLRGAPGVPEFRDHFTLGEHHFLVEEFIDGTTLNQLAVSKYPLLAEAPDPQALADYAAWAISVHEEVDRVVAGIHDRGVVFGDLHQFNVLVRPDERCALIDFEVSCRAEERARSTLAHPGFAAPPERRGTEIDEYALACLRLGLFAPTLTVLFQLNRAKVVQLAELIAEHFPVPRALLDHPVRVVLGLEPDADAGQVEDLPEVRALRALPMPSGDVDEWPILRTSMAQAILASADPERDDRLFPGDIAQFDSDGGGLAFASGAAGVLYALEVTGAGRSEQHESWLLDRLAAPAPLRPGFYDGSHGIAHVLDRLGHRQRALDLLAEAQKHPLESLDGSLFSGLSGIGLNLYHFARRTGERGFADLADRAVAIAADRLGPVDGVPEVSGGSNPVAGLLYGPSGTALLFLHAHEHNGDPGLLDLARTAIRQDLRRCVTRDDGSLQVEEGWRTNPYIDQGSAGIGLAIGRYLRHRDDDELRAAAAAIRPVTGFGFYVQAALFAGRAGAIACRAIEAGTGPGAMRGDPSIAAQVRRLAWHALPYRGHLAFPGAQSLRLSMDFATGTAGVLFALGSAMHDEPVCLPFLEPRPTGQSAGRAADRSTQGEEV